MIRKQIYLTEELDQKVKLLARQRNVAEAEIIREALENLGTYSVAGTSEQRMVRETATLSYGASVMDRNQQGIGRELRQKLNDDAWERLLGQMEQRARLATDSGDKRTWTREELYDERLDRFSR